MNQFTTETIVNSDIFTLGSTADVLRVATVGNFKPTNITAIYKRAATLAKNEVGTIAIPAGPISPAEAATYRLHIELGQVGAHTSEFANSLTRNKKVLDVEVAAGVAATAVDIADALRASIRLQNRESKNILVNVDADGDATITLTVADENIRLQKVELQVLKADSLTGYDSFTVLATGVVTVPGAEGFGTARWILKNLRLPTMANTNWTAITQDERPVAGGLYDQYTIHQSVNRGELTGNGAVGQELVSKTTHVLYVLVGAPATALVAAVGALLPAVTITTV